MFQFDYQRPVVAAEVGCNHMGRMEIAKELIELAQALAADVPIYVVVTAIDSLWGFGDVFRWTQHRSDEGGSIPTRIRSKR